MSSARGGSLAVTVRGVFASAAILGLGSWALFAASGAAWPKALLVADGAFVLLGPSILLPWWAARRARSDAARKEHYAAHSTSSIFSARRVVWSIIVCVVTLAVGVAVEVSDPGDPLGDAAIFLTTFLALLVVGAVASRPAK